MWYFAVLLALAVMNTRLCWGAVKETLSLQTRSTFQNHLQMYKLFLNHLQWSATFFPPFRKVFSWFFNLCGVNQNASVCLFSPPLSQSAIFPFDLLFIWLSLCTTRLFILHFNIWWGHLWSWESSSGVVLVDKSFVSVCSFTNYCQDWNIFLNLVNCTI